ncbi:MAG TPA: hypothetical protein VG502_21580 [Flexivirga sp.]|uniref:hypothetical protein n=1 Tax=Flexivirga sp. TaxID=1962927 RepID=UPI002BF547DF|nr:hypothetical protein [Flexivirga sp.]HWC24899.1 hypothetical protein [Flexivirga sp.]
MSNQGDGRPPEDSGGQQGEPGGHWTSGQQPWASGGQGAQPPSWSTDRTGPNVGPTMNNQQSSYYDRFSEASGEGLKIPQGGGGGGRGKVLIGLAAALVVIVAAVAIFAFTRGDDSPKQAGGSSSTSALPPVKATTWTNPTVAVGARPVKDGWQVQSSDSEALRGQYDVPKSKDWKVTSGGYSLAYTDKSNKPVAGAGGVARFGVGYCSAEDNAESAWVGVRGVGSSDPTDAGPKWAKKFADTIAGGKKKSAKPGKVSAAKKVKVDQGTIPALQYTVTTEAGDPNSCTKGRKYEIRTINFTTPGKSFQMVTVRILGVSKELPAKQLDEIISTFRPKN